MSIKFFNAQPTAKTYQILVFMAAFLLFAVQPMIGKFILPWFGGSPSVWTAALLFFQTLLLAGYSYAHLINRLKIPYQKLFYLAPLLITLLLLPITPDTSWQPTGNTEPLTHILLLLLVTIGLPYLVLAASSPLLQSWFSQSGAEISAYRLYVWSNAGSLLGLFSYPIFIEPIFTLEQQTRLWSAMFAMFVAGIIYLVWSWRPQPTSASQAELPAAPKPKATQKILWVVLPALASLLLVATTNYITQDIAAVPFLWILPLGLYLLSFIITFHSDANYDRKFLQPLFIIVSLLGVYLVVEGGGLPITMMLGGSLAMLFIYCVVCHGELYALRPHPRYLTSFYLWLSTGGALGGAFVALAAPMIFPLYFEFHLGVGLTFVVVALLWLKNRTWLPIVKSNLLRQAVLWLTIITIVGGLGINIKKTLTQPTWVSRDFFGVLRIFKLPSHTALYHGHILHGTQFADEEKQCWATTYYGPASGIGRAAAALESDSIRLGAVGLGAGTVATYAQYVKFYELSPAVQRVAEQDFTYLSRCADQAEVVIGDARLSLEREAPQEFDILVIDAFSSDNIPVHLLTREATAVYLTHIKKTGALAIHISNNYVNLEPVIADLARHFQLSAVITKNSSDKQNGSTGSTWALLSYDQEFFEKLADDTTADKDKNVNTLKRSVTWTDKYSNLLSVLRIK